MNKVFDGLVGILRENSVDIDHSSLKMDDDILEDLDIDSITVVGIIPEIEDRFGITLDPLTLLEKSTVKEFIAEIEKLQSEN